jgi:abortive infection bacteriophage resistance protein
MGNANINAAFFVLEMVMPVNPFGKLPYSSSDLVRLMQSRGLVISDALRVERHLNFVGYYRLMGYGKYFFDSANQTFRAGTTYEDIWRTYKFDRKLRLLTLDAIERIEVAIRTAMSNEMSMQHGPHWFMDASLFNTPNDRNDFCSALRRELPSKKNEITIHYYNKYDFPDLPPSWMIMECISMGPWLKALRNLKQVEQKRISAIFGINNISLISWASSLSWVRNVCAHHGILWNRANVRPPKTPPANMNYPSIAGKEASYFAIAVIAYGLLKLIVSRSTWANRLADLFAEYPTVKVTAMGFNPGWENDPFWR